jgi:putative oxidoreductase
MTSVTIEGLLFSAVGFKLMRPSRTTRSSNIAELRWFALLLWRSSLAWQLVGFCNGAAKVGKSRRSQHLRPCWLRQSNQPAKSPVGKGVNIYLDKKNPYIRVIILSAGCPTWGSELATEGMSMIRKLIATDNDIATTILRLVLGVIFFAHGAQKMLGWFGGYGFTGTMGFFTGVMHIPAVFAFLAIAAEFFGGLGLIFGLLTRVASFGIFCNMIVAVALVHGRFGFFMNWAGAQKGEGYEYHLLVLATSAFLMIRGAGAASVDRLLSSPVNNRIKAQARPQAA